MRSHRMIDRAIGDAPSKAAMKPLRASDNYVIKEEARYIVAKKDLL